MDKPESGTIKNQQHAKVGIGQAILRGRESMLDTAIAPGPLTAAYMYFIGGTSKPADRRSLLKVIQYSVPEDPARGRIADKPAGRFYTHGPSPEAQRLMQGVGGDVQARLSQIGIFLQSAQLLSPKKKGFWEELQNDPKATLKYFGKDMRHPLYPAKPALVPFLAVAHGISTSCCWA